MKTPNEHEKISYPKIKVNGGIYSFKWIDEKIMITLNRIREDSRHTLSGEIAVYKIYMDDDKERLKHLHQARLNLTSTRSRKDLIGTLIERCGEDNLDWFSIIEQVCVLTLKKFREGEPIIAIDDIQNISNETQYILKPFVLARQPNLFYGMGKAGKSYMACYLSVLLSQEHNVLYLDYEDDTENIARRIKFIQKGLGYPATNIQYRTCYHSLTDYVEELQKILVEKNIDIVVLDSIACACGADPERADTATNFFNALRSLHTTSILIAHTQKNAEVKSVFGSGFWTNRARSIFFVKKSQEYGSPVFIIGIYHQHINNDEPSKPIALEFTIDKLNGTAKIVRKELYEVPELLDNLTLKERIRAYLIAKGQKTTQDIAEALGEQIESVRAKLHKHHNLFIKFDDKWGVISYEI